MTKKLLPATVLALALLFGCWQGALQSVQAKPLPYYEEAGTGTQYKNFIRGHYAMDTGSVYVLLMEWEQGSTFALYLTGENGHREKVSITSGVPHTFTVPQAGLYRFEAALDGSEITGLTYSLYMYT